MGEGDEGTDEEKSVFGTALTYALLRLRRAYARHMPSSQWAAVGDDSRARVEEVPVDMMSRFSASARLAPADATTSRRRAP